MNIRNKVITMCLAALLSAIGILIPLISPFKIMIEPASFTLASHVAIFIAMFISPPVAIFVALITSYGFFVTYPIVIALRAATHLIFATTGAFILKKNSNLLYSPKKTALFAFIISIIHAVAEVLVVTYYYFGRIGLKELYYEKGYLVSVLLLVGVGTIVHSMVDFYIALFVWKPIQHSLSLPVSAKVK